MKGMLQILLYEVPSCVFHHIVGNLFLVPWRCWTDLEGFIFKEPILLHYIRSLDRGLCFGDSYFSLVGW
jgi:hypothetical protein